MSMPNLSWEEISELSHALKNERTVLGVIVHQLKKLRGNNEMDYLLGKLRDIDDSLKKIQERMDNIVNDIEN